MPSLPTSCISALKTDMGLVRSSGLRKTILQNLLKIQCVANNFLMFTAKHALISDFCFLYASKFSCIGKTIFSFFRLTCACLQQQFFYTRIFMYKCIETFPLLAKKTFESDWESIKPVKLTFNRYTPCSIW